ncbi:hypothetical protein DOY81_008765 [Sarcophaga bullata]|nr:hypothetical protein DOY81_008765 [Sarcophaga bullata]
MLSFYFAFEHKTHGLTVTMKSFSSFKLFTLFMTLTMLLSLENVNSAKILSVFGFPGPSQYIMASALLKALAERGHEITSVSTFPQKKPLKNFRDLPVMENSKLFEGIMVQAVNKKEDPGYFAEWRGYGEIGLQMVTNVLENPQFRNLLDNEKFDLIIVEAFMTETLYGLGEHFNASMVGVSTFGTINFVDVLVGNISPASYIPHIHLPFDNKMTLKERLFNVVFNFLDDFHYHQVMLPRQEQLYQKYFPLAKLTLREAQKSFALVLINQHFTLSYPRPYVSNMIEVGGLHIKQKPDPLPLDMQQFLDNATEGAIYFSMGSNLKSKDISKETLNIFLDTFPESLPNKPDNVFIKAWYPQPSILAHPNVKLFISHGGFLSTTEAIFHGKPILGIPVLGDQPMNVKNAVKEGYALSLKLDEITKESFKAKIMELLTNERYTKRVQQLSRRYRDQPQTPLEKAVYWIEYVLRHDGAPHLRNAGVELNYFQFYNIDAYFILSIILLIFLIAFISILRFIVKFIRAEGGEGKIKVKRN